MSLLHRLPWTEQAMQVLAKSKTHTQHHINHLNLTPCHTIRITKGGMRNMLSSIPGTSFYSCIFRAFGDWHPLRLPQDGAGRTWGISNETITWITGKGRQKQPQANSWISTHLSVPYDPCSFFVGYRWSRYIFFLPTLMCQLGPLMSSQVKGISQNQRQKRGTVLLTIAICAPKRATDHRCWASDMKSNRLEYLAQADTWIKQ